MQKAERAVLELIYSVVKGIGEVEILFDTL